MAFGSRRVFRTTLIARREVADRTLEVSFERPAGFAFAAGQYIQARVPELIRRDVKGPSRVFSIASPPRDSERISIAFRETGSGFKTTLREVDLGSEVTIEGPHGFYTLPPDPSRRLVLVAGGIGITPFMSMLRSVAGRNDEAPRITLLYANRSPKTAPYLGVLEEMEKGNPRLRLKKQFGLLDEESIRRNVKDLARPTWYVSGPSAMVDSVRQSLHLLGIPSWRVNFEEFIGY